MVYINKFINKKFFIHKINLDIIKQCLANNKLGFLDDNVKYDVTIQENDDILFCTEFNNELIFFGYTEVKSLFEDEEDLYGVYKSTQKLQLKGVKFFIKPILNNKFVLKDDFDYLEISQEDFNNVRPNKYDIIKSFPFYLKENVNIKLDKFLEITKDNLDFLINDSICNKTIKDNSKILNKILSNYEVNYFKGNRYVILDLNDSNIFKINVDSEMLDSLYEKNLFKLGSIKNDSIKKVKPNDYVLFFTNLGKLSFFGIGKVQYNLFDKFKYYTPENTLKFSEIYYFEEPVEFLNVKDELKINNLRSDNRYTIISKVDTEKIITKSNLIYNCPSYLRNHVVSFTEFVILTIKNVFYIINNLSDVKQISIKKFLAYVKIILSNYGISLSSQELEEFYSIYAIEMGFSHSPSADEPELLIPLRLKYGGVKHMSYINFV